MHEIGCVSRPRLGARGQAPAGDLYPLGADRRRDAGRGRRDQHVHRLEGARGAAREPVAHALCAHHPRRRDERVGEEAVARHRVEVLRARAQVVQVQRAAFAAGDQEGGRARALDLGQLDQPRRAERLRHRVDGGQRLGLRHLAEPAAEHADAQPGGAARRAPAPWARPRAARRTGRRGRRPASRRRRARGRRTLRANGPRWSRLATKG